MLDIHSKNLFSLIKISLVNNMLKFNSLEYFLTQTKIIYNQT